MVILIQKHMNDPGKSTAMKQAADNQFQRNEAALKCPASAEASQAQPLQVLHTYMDQYLKDIDELDDQMDWDYFQNDNDEPTSMQE